MLRKKSLITLTHAKQNVLTYELLQSQKKEITEGNKIEVNKILPT